MRFNKEQYLFLVKEEEKCKKTGDYMGFINYTRFKDLIKLAGTLENQSFWENRDQYLKITQRLLDQDQLLSQTFPNQVSSVDEFLCDFYDLRAADLEKIRIWTKKFETETFNLDINPESEGFRVLIQLMFDIFENYNSDITPELEDKNNPIPYAIGPNNLGIIIKNQILPKLKIYCR